MRHKMTVAPLGELEILFTRKFNAPRAKVWKALTTPEIIKQWLGSMPGWSWVVCVFEPKVGTDYRYEWAHESGTRMGMGGKILEAQAPERLVATERFDESWYPGDAVDTTVLTEAADVTTLTLTVRYTTKEARDGVLAGPAAGGMESGYDALEELLQTL